MALKCYWSVPRDLCWYTSSAHITRPGTMLNRLFESMLAGRASQGSSLARWALAARELRWKLLAGRSPVYLEFLPTCKPRYGYGLAPHKQLEALMSRNMA